VTDFRRSPAIQPGYLAGREPGNKGKTYPPEVLTRDEITALVRRCSNRAPTGQRNRALIVVLHHTGIRIAEAVGQRDRETGAWEGGLFPRDIDTRAGTLTVRHGKGDRHRTLGIDPAALAILERWLDTRRRLGIGPRRRLFCTLAGEPLNDSYVRQLLHRVAAKAGIDKRVTPHSLRHTFAFEQVMERGTPPPLLQAMLGHASLRTTTRYTRHVAPKDVIDAMRDRGWEQGT
jgi:site-specific recombinase XerD